MSDSRVEDLSTFDFESYISNYEGYTRIARSLFIAKHSHAPLAIEAYKSAIQDIKANTFNTAKYKLALECLNSELSSQGQPSVPIDQDWINEAQQKSKSTIEALEHDLKTAKSNLAKDEIRLCHTRIGDQYYKKGDLPTAMKNYVRTRDYCSTSQNVIDMCFNTIKVYLDDRNYSHVVQTYISRAEATPNMPDKVNTLSKLRCCQAISLLGGSDSPNRYRAVATALTEVSFESASHVSDIMSANDVAIYGSLCALVSYDRRQFNTHILNNTNFKNFLVVEPSLYELLEAFYKSKYAICFELLEKYKQTLALDIYLASHIQALVQLVREKAMVQYCIPYSMIDMRKMATAFNMDLDALENDLVTLIGKKQKISARIDSHQKILCTKKQEKRSEALERSLLAGDEFDKSSKALLLRLHLLKANLIVK
ncbi:26S proteasome subunit RPN7-domain-containing protein [Gilbertella persicaria]|uniref:26S proteasome subunit RPN7-domain-containing protein n=1 Tax=Gilbertella persicaria TaxID=101096 RepID=UPI00221FCDC5|nr:26S proteasome subunit RPN7-domain-containing protein [Gilbertella persicaria]KAI8061814.1 26S proteasome subunit RPN7-domain-containing protein [Gilbertella persicaria]